MSDIPAELHYTKDHEWLRSETGGAVVVGITHHAQSQLGDLVYVELPEVGRQVKAGDALAVVESTKAASDVYSPVSGTVLAINEALGADPDLVNTQPYGGGWLVRLQVTVAATDLLDANAYQQLLAAGH
jgi:glycine cleavage system H protein